MASSASEASGAAPPHLVFVVNNDALGDARVVKTARVAATQGFNCTVIGCYSDRSSEPRHLHCEGIDFRIYPLRRVTPLTLVAAYLPRLYAMLASAAPDARGPAEQMPGFVDLSSEAVSALGWAPKTAASFEQKAQPQPVAPGASGAERPSRMTLRSFTGRVLARFASLVRRVLGRVRLLRRRLSVALHPSRSALGARLLFGRYLQTFYPAILARHPDVVYAHELWTLEACALARRQLGARPLVYDSHELELHRNNNWCARANAARVRYESRYITDAAAVVTVCDSIAEYLGSVYHLPTCFTVPNAPLSSSLITLEAEQHLKVRLGVNGGPLIVYTGKVTSGRGLDNVIPTLAELPTAHFAMVGPTAQPVLRDLVALAVSCGVEERVHFVPKVPPEILVSLISDADVAVVPIEDVCLSYHFSLPNKLFEAAMAGVPILASPLPELEKFVTSFGLGEIVDFSEREQVKRKIVEVVENRAAYNAPAKALHLRHLLAFESAAGRLFHDLKDLAATPPRRWAATPTCEGENR